jgi:uncharacterized protein YndB with AHSA1/START domain
MNRQIKLETSVIINATSDRVWEALTNKEIVAQYFWGTEVISTWKKGDPIVYTGKYEGVDYEDKGIILEIETNKILKHTYWTSFSEIPYDPNISAIITYTIDNESSTSKLTVTQEGFNNEEERDKSLKSWKDILLNIKIIIETR